MQGHRGPEDPYAEDWDGRDDDGPPYWFAGQHLPEDVEEEVEGVAIGMHQQ